MVATHTAAKAVGITGIDAYMFLVSSPQSTNHLSF